MHNTSGNAPGLTGKSEWWRWLNLLKSRMQHGHPGVGGPVGGLEYQSLEQPFWEWCWLAMSRWHQLQKTGEVIA